MIPKNPGPSGLPPGDKVLGKWSACRTLSNGDQQRRQLLPGVLFIRDDTQKRQRLESESAHQASAATQCNGSRYFRGTQHATGGDRARGVSALRTSLQDTEAGVLDDTEAPAVLRCNPTLSLSLDLFICT